MKPATTTACLVVAFVCVVSAIAASGPNARSDSKSCVAPHEWFPQAPIPANKRPDPNSDCEFYRWAWQTFLFVTQSAGDADSPPRFLSFPSASELLVSVHGRDHVRMFIPHNMHAVLQPGSLGMVIDQNGNVLYYGTHVSPEFVKFVGDNELTTSDRLKNAPPDLQFPKGSLELKSSWKIVAAGDDAGGFFTVRAHVPVFRSKRNGEIVVDPINVREETLALLGLHVVGVVDGHPEFIWATFEHNDNAPDLPVGLSTQTSQAVDLTRSWTLYAKGTKAVECNKKPERSTALKLFAEKKQTLAAPVSVFREFAFGGDDEPDVIRGLNNSVHDQLPLQLAIWKNYNFIGAMWLNDPDRDFKENADFNGEAAVHSERKVLGGDVKLSNATMETFTQSIQNCFSCHDTMGRSLSHGDHMPGKRLNMSHVLTELAKGD